MHWFLRLLVIFVVVFVMHRLFLKKKKKKRKTRKKDPVQVKKDPILEYLNNLKNINLAVRIDHEYEKSLKVKTEEVIDKLWKILPEVNRANPSAELTWVINKMAREYLPDLVQRYVKLEGELKEKLQPETMTALIALEGEIDSVITIMNEQDEMKLKSQARYLKDKFFKNDKIH